MKNTVRVLSLMLLIAPTCAAFAQAGPTAAAGKCERLKSDWRDGEIALARNAAEGLTDDSAPRATMRAAEDTATYAKASLTLRLIELNRCPAPDHAPSSTTFLTDALACKVAETKASLAELQAGLPACDSKTWKAA